LGLEVTSPTLETLVAWDTETHLIQPGLRAPPLVCGSEATAVPGSERVLSKADARGRFRKLISDPSIHLGGANLVYDLGVHCADDPAVLPYVFEALEAGRLHSTDILEALHDNARGLMFQEASGKPFARYSLQLLENRYLGIDREAEKHGVNSWRLRYAELDGVPLEQWPPEAIEYPRHDARGTFDILALQLGLTPGPTPRENLQCEAAEMRAAWALALSALWGMRTDPRMVGEVVGEIQTEHEHSRRVFFDAGFVRVRPCTKKDGEYERADAIDQVWLDQTVVRLGSALRTGAPVPEWLGRRLEDLEVARVALAKGRPVRFAEDRASVRAAVVDAYQGRPPMTAGGAHRGPEVSTSRDTLVGSGVPLLEEYGEAGPNEKLLSTYVDVLTQGTRVPINPEINSIVATQRTSYRLPNLQQLPRKGLIRTCFVPRGRPARYVFCSVDYSALELCTLGQVCLTLFGHSDMADAINAGQDLHARLAGRFLGISYVDAIARKDAKDPLMLALRQAAKPVNFGLPGLMGAPKLVFTARKDGVVFCELAGLSAEGECGKNKRVTEFKSRAIMPTCEKCLDLACTYKSLWYEEWPEMQEYHRVTPVAAEGCAAGEPLESFGDGMKRLETSANAASNHFFQNLAAQGAKRALWYVTRACYNDPASPLFGNAHPVVFVHDEIITEIREEVAHECAHEQARLMVAAMREFTPDVIIKAEPAIARRWFKGMEPAHDRVGRLRPWWPPDGKREWTWGPDQALMAADLAA
jgi:DNA polymerase I